MFILLEKLRKGEGGGGGTKYQKNIRARENSVKINYNITKVNRALWLVS